MGMEEIRYTYGLLGQIGFPYLFGYWYKEQLEKETVRQQGNSLQRHGSVDVSGDSLWLLETLPVPFTTVSLSNDSFFLKPPPFLVYPMLWAQASVRVLTLCTLDWHLKLPTHRALCPQLCSSMATMPWPPSARAECLMQLNSSLFVYAQQGFLFCAV